MNTDSENAYGNLVEKLVGQSAVDASKKIVETAVDKGYLKEGLPVLFLVNQYGLQVRILFHS